MKKILMALPFVLASSVAANAAIALGKGVSLSGTGEVDLINKFNNPVRKNNLEQKAGYAIVPEATITINVDGKHNSSIGNVVWRLAQKTDTDNTYDGIGVREAWFGLESKIGTLTLGNQIGLVYNAIDGFSAAGTGNVFGDVGGHSLQYTRAALYQTPSFANTTLAVQTNMPATVSVKTNIPSSINVIGVANQNYKYEKQYAVDVLLKHNGEALKANLGYSYGKNGKMNSSLLASDFSSTNRGNYTNVIPYEKDNSVIFASASYTLPVGVMIGGAYKHDNITSHTNEGSNSVKNNSLLALIGYTMGNNKITIGYTHIFDASEGGSKLKGSKVNQIAAQYDRALAENISLFVSGRYQVINNAEYAGLYSNDDPRNSANIKNFDDSIKKSSGRVVLGVTAKV